MNRTNENNGCIENLREEAWTLITQMTDAQIEKALTAFMSADTKGCDWDQ